MKLGFWLAACNFEQEYILYDLNRGLGMITDIYLNQLGVVSMKCLLLSDHQKIFEKLILNYTLWAYSLIFHGVKVLRTFKHHITYKLSLSC